MYASLTIEHGFDGADDVTVDLSGSDVATITTGLRLAAEWWQDKHDGWKDGTSDLAALVVRHCAEQAEEYERLVARIEAAEEGEV